MEYLYDMGYLINRSMYRVLKNEGYLYDDSKRQFTEAELQDAELMAEETYKDIAEFLKNEFSTHGFHDNTFTCCFDDKDFQLRADYKKRNTPELNKKIKYLAQNKLLQLPETPRFKKFVGYGMEADDWIYTLRLQNSAKGLSTTFVTSDCDLLCNIDKYTTGIICKARESYPVTKDSWEVAIDEAFKPIPYNTVWLYKVTVGDPSDSIAGVVKFGPKAFEKMIAAMKEAGIPFHTLQTFQGFTTFLEHPNGLRRFLSEEQYNQALDAWQLVAPIPLEEAMVRYEQEKPSMTM